MFWDASPIVHVLFNSIGGMRKLCFAIAFVAYPFVASSADYLDDAIQNVRDKCVGISARLDKMKTMAGINTAVTGVGTGVGVGATMVGMVKASTDKKIEEYEQEIAELRAAGVKPIETDEEFAEIFGGFLIESGDDDLRQAGLMIQKKHRAEKQSKSLGNWRTGLLAVNTATNVTGVVIAGTNRVKGDLKEHINLCLQSVDLLRTALMQARLDDATVNAYDLSHAQKIVDACGEWEYVDFSKIDNRTRGATISSGVGAGTGLTGTIVSAVANSDKVRSDDTESGKSKEKNLNTTANVLAGTATAATGVATVFNATQISAIKRVVSVADSCEEVLR